MKKVWKIFLVDDHSLFRDGLKFILKQTKDIRVCGEASNGFDFLKKLRIHRPDVVLMDISMPEMDGIETSILALKKLPDLKILALTMITDEQMLRKIIMAGVKGFLTKESDPEELIEAIRNVAAGNSHFSTQIMAKIMKSFPSFSRGELPLAQNIKLTQRENHILKMICEGLSNKEISERIKLSQRTVEGIRSGLLNKTGTANSLNLALFAYHNNLIK
ncbi:MAG: response regulator transcription factor [Bacteroidota bacterium]